MKNRPNLITPSRFSRIQEKGRTDISGSFHFKLYFKYHHFFMKKIYSKYFEENQNIISKEGRLMMFFAIFTNKPIFNFSTLSFQKILCKIKNKSVQHWQYMNNLCKIKDYWVLRYHALNFTVDVLNECQNNYNCTKKKKTGGEVVLQSFTDNFFDINMTWSI